MTGIDLLIREAGGPRAVRTVLDVGAFDGDDSLPVAVRYPEIRVVAIEPTPETADALRRRSQHLPNYTVVETAIGESDSHGRLNVFSDHPSLNSLNAMRAEGAALFDLHGPEPGETRWVTVKRLETVCDELGIQNVDVLHIDTQGSDLVALQSLDRARLRTVRAGVIEVGYRTRLYETSPEKGDALRILRSLGFRVVRVERMHFATSLEHNYFFVPSRRGELIDRWTFRAHFAAAEIGAARLRWGGRRVQELRVRAAVKTRLRGGRPS